MKKFIIILVVVILVGLGVYFFYQSSSPVVDTTAETAQQKLDRQATEARRTGQTVPAEASEVIIGKSVEGRDITAYNYGNGSTTILFVGGIHGGYAWNTALVAYELMDYLKANPNAIPQNLQVTVIPVLNPDGLNKVVGTAGRFTKADVNPSATVQASGRFNANTVDLNRNFDCDWQSSGTWQSKAVSGGSEAFSEPESMAFQKYVEAQSPSAVVVWDSAAGGVFASNCHDGVLPATSAITDAYAKASGYKAYESFDFYAVTGDVVNWLAKKSIPAISVLLTSHDDSEWDKNKAGIEALLLHYAK